MRLLSLCLAGVLVLSAHVPRAQADELTAAKRADIQRLFEMTDAMALAKQVGRDTATAITKTLKKSHPDIPNDVLDIVPAEVDALIGEHIGSLMERGVPLYADNFTHDEIRALLQFYGSDIGKKVIATTPTLIRQSFAISRQWGEELSPVLQERIRQRLLERGVRL